MIPGLRTGPAQTWGAARLVPLLRDEPIADLRLHARLHDDELSIVELTPREAYIAFVPHAFVATWTSDGTPAAAYGTQLLDPRDGGLPRVAGLRFRRRMARREDRGRLRFLPLHLAMEGFLDLQFDGPPIAWQEWTREAVTRGLSPRVEESYRGAQVQGLDDALRIFEIHPGQCGLALYLADALASVFVVPHPDDYRALHPTLLRDFYGELLYLYTQLYPEVPGFAQPLDAARVHSFADLRAEVERVRGEWVRFHDDVMLTLRAMPSRPVYRMGRFTLGRFLPPFDPALDNHIGESIVDESGTVAYLKTFRLSAAQARRGHLLSVLAAHEWNLDATAAALGTDRAGLVVRLERAGFGYLLRAAVSR
ncbi:ARPP-2 domain-containing protein [Dactylosporangium darangshiense]|uniref:ARG and Rhodanese-Phosphatase-superfamily-associated domain-containing protein n=1 Tax=Dactylosporangium darangshiense TaxID=579108 RepID=A0ABP8D8N0_9ACTN